MSHLVHTLSSTARIPGFTRILSSFSNLVISQPHRFSSDASAPAVVKNAEAATAKAQDDGVFNLLETPVELTEEQILSKRNKSRLYDPHRRMANGEIDHPIPELSHNWMHKTIKHQRKVHAQFGEKSGLPPGIHWPDYEDLQSRKEYESVAQPFTFHEMIENAKEKRRLEKEAFENRAAEVEANMAKVEKLKQDIIAKKSAKDKEAHIAQERREALIEEVRRHFGYKVDPREEKFQELLEKKEKEQKKLMKDSRKKEREAKLLAQLLGGDKDKKKKYTSKDKGDGSSKKKGESETADD